MVAREILARVPSFPLETLADCRLTNPPPPFPMSNLLGQRIYFFADGYPSTGVVTFDDGVKDLEVGNGAHRVPRGAVRATAEEAAEACLTDLEERMDYCHRVLDGRIKLKF